MSCWEYKNVQNFFKLTLVMTVTLFIIALSSNGANIWAQWDNLLAAVPRAATVKDESLQRPTVSRCQTMTRGPKLACRQRHHIWPASIRLHMSPLGLQIPESSAQSGLSLEDMNMMTALVRYHYYYYYFEIYYQTEACK